MRLQKLIVGLGNPGLSYARSRHNLGASWVQDWARVYRLPAFKKEAKFQALVTRGEVAGQNLILALPQTFMNLSGVSVAALLNFYKLRQSEDLLLVFDDLDLNFGRFKLSPSFPRGHNGVISVREKLGSLTGWGLRLGVDDREGKRVINSADYVLQNFSAEQLTCLSDEVFPSAREEVLHSWLLKK
jgi:PTH1 family peptidyl-tRNA hydrolase